MRYYMRNLPWYPHIFTKGELGIINDFILLYTLSTTNLDTQWSKIEFSFNNHSCLDNPPHKHAHTPDLAMSPPSKSFYLYHYIAVYIYIYIYILCIYIYIYIYITSAQIVFHSIEWTSHKSRMTFFFAAIPINAQHCIFMYWSIQWMSFRCRDFHNGSLFCTMKRNMKPNWESHLKLGQHWTCPFYYNIWKEIISCPGWVAEYTRWWDAHQHNYSVPVHSEHEIFVTMYNLSLFPEISVNHTQTSKFHILHKRDWIIETVG